MKIKLTLTVFALLFISPNSFAQIDLLINNFKLAYSSGDPKVYIDNTESLISILSSEEKPKGERILTLFKVLTNNEQSMSTKDFNAAMDDVGLAAVLEKDINPNLSLIIIKIGAYRSRLVFNTSSKSYKFNLKGFHKTASGTSTNNFNGGIMGHHCRIVNYSNTPYRYTVASVSLISSSF